MKENGAFILEKEDEKPVYSYHTFLFPFRWDIEKIATNKKFGDKLSADWEERYEKDCKFDDKRKPQLEYNEREYFHENVQKAIYGSEDNENTVLNYFFKHEKIKKDKPQFIIEKNFKKKDLVEKRIWQLELNAIRLKLFSTGVGIIIYELENCNHKTLDDVLKINEFGRRIDIPYIGKRNGEKYCDEVPDSVEITNGIAKCNYKEVINKFSGIEEDYEFISPIITNVLGNKITFKNNEEDKVRCYQIGDDRMFTLSCLRDSTIVDSWTKKRALNNSNSEEEYPYLVPTSDISEELYQFIFIDGNFCSCQSQIMRKDLLQTAIYDRWVDWGTFHAVTNHSFVCGTAIDNDENSGVTDTVVNPFLTMYIQMAILVLAQRASIISLCQEASKLAQNFNGDGKINKKIVSDIRKLQEKYVAFQNQFLFFEVTAQEQGIEIYERLQNSLYVDREITQLENQLKNLHEIANLDSDRSLNNWVTLGGWIGGGIAILALILDFFSANRNCLSNSIFWGMVIIIVIGIPIVKNKFWQK
jgi:hypothetical protein